MKFWFTEAQEERRRKRTHTHTHTHTHTYSFLGHLNFLVLIYIPKTDVCHGEPMYRKQTTNTAVRDAVLSCLTHYLRTTLEHCSCIFLLTGISKVTRIATWRNVINPRAPLTQLILIYLMQSFCSQEFGGKCGHFGVMISESSVCWEAVTQSFFSRKSLH